MVKPALDSSRVRLKCNGPFQRDSEWIPGSPFRYESSEFCYLRFSLKSPKEKRYSLLKLPHFKQFSYFSSLWDQRRDLIGICIIIFLKLRYIVWCKLLPIRADEG